MTCSGWPAIAAAIAVMRVASPAQSAPPPQAFVADSMSLLGIGQRLEAEGRIERSAKIYAALTSDPDAAVRAEARFRLARIEMVKRDWRRAAILLRRALDDRPDAAPTRLALAQALAEIGDEAAALRELRAVQATGLPPTVARMVDRFSDALRARRPFGASLEIALTPDSNINRATTSDTLATVIGEFEIAPGSKSKSGMGVSLRGAAHARHSVSESLSLLVRGSLGADLYRDKAFNYVAATLAAGPELRLGPVTANLEGEIGRRWFGMKPYEDSLRIGLSGAVPLGRKTLARATVDFAKINNRMNTLQDGRTFTGELGLERALDARTGIALSLKAERAALADPGYSTTAWRSQLVAWREVGRITTHLTASYGQLDADDRLSLFAERRKDINWRLGIGATMRRFQFGGFAPVMRYTIERNRSSVEIYDFSRRRAEFGFVRAF